MLQYKQGYLPFSNISVLFRREWILLKISLRLRYFCSFWPTFKIYYPGMKLLILISLHPWYIKALATQLNSYYIRNSNFNMCVVFSPSLKLFAFQKDCRHKNVCEIDIDFFLLVVDVYGRSAGPLQIRDWRGPAFQLPELCQIEQ